MLTALMFLCVGGGEQRDSIKAQDLQHHWTGAVQKRSLIHTDGVQNKGDIKKKPSETYISFS